MSEITEPYAEIDFTDLDFDIESHREGIKAMARLGLHPHSVKPTLRARNLVFVRVLSAKFRVGIVPGDCTEQAPFEVIYQADSLAEAKGIRGEVERYFLRHFPGRVLSREDPAQPNTEPGSCQVIVIYYTS